jgi:hypothetical protein
MLLRRAATIALIAPLAAVSVACSDDSGDDASSVDPSACNTSLSVVDAADAGGVDGQFGAQMVEIAGGDDAEELVLAVSGFELPDGTIPAGDPGAPDDTNVLVVTLAAPEGGVADGQTFTDGTGAADGEITAVTFYRGADEIDLDPLTVTLGEITEDTICGAIEASGAGVEGEFKAERVEAELSGAPTPDTTATSVAVTASS